MYVLINSSLFPQLLTPRFMSTHWNVLHRTVIATSPLALAYFELESAVFTGLCDDAEASDTGLVCAVLITFSLGPYLKLQIIGHSTQYLFAVVAEWHQVQWYVLRSDSIYFCSIPDTCHRMAGVLFDRGPITQRA